jgi:hypothetical protein
VSQFTPFAVVTANTGVTLHPGLRHPLPPVPVILPDGVIAMACSAMAALVRGRRMTSE